MKTFSAISALLASGVLGLGLAFGQMVSPAAASEAQTAPVTGTSSPINSASSPAAAAAAIAAMPVDMAPAGTEASPAGNAKAGSAPAGTASAPAAGGGMQAPAAAGSKGFRFPAYTSANVDGPYIAITFDDGPNPETTPKLLKILAARGIKATFFVVGTRASENPGLLREMAVEGHEIGNHSWNHPQLPKVSVEEADRQVSSTSDAIRAATGSAPHYMRPPYGAMTQTLRKHLEDKFGLAMVYWSADSLDWKNRNTESIYSKVMAQTRPGGIILLHDIHATTVAAMPKVLDALLAKGYKFVTVSQLIAMDKPAAPKAVAAASSATRVASKPKPVTRVSASPQRPAARPATATQPVTPVKLPGSLGLF